MECTTNHKSVIWLVYLSKFKVIQKANQDKKFTYKREGCPETHYADSYYTMKHKSLFSNHKQK